MVPAFIRSGLVLLLLSGSPAFAFDNPLSDIRLANFDPLDRGPLADFLTLFRQQAIPRELVAWHRGYAPGTVVVSTTERRLYYVLRGGERSNMVSALAEKASPGPAPRR